MSRPTISDFDDWRMMYPAMTDDERRAWDARCYEWWPEQAHGHTTWMGEALALAGPNPRVVEVGGWRGDHAAHFLSEDPSLASWLNIEFCAQAAASPKTLDPRYTVRVPERFRWFEDEVLPSGDILILSHVAEHLSGPDLASLLDSALHFPLVYMEAPLPKGGTDWKGYEGTHILDLGWDAVVAMMEARHFRVGREEAEARVFVKP